MRISVFYGDVFGERVLGNLINYSTFCESCGLTCGHCRNEYPSFSADIVDVVNLPTKLPPFLEDPSVYYPKQLQCCDLILAVGLHPDLLTFIPDIAGMTRSKAAIVPIENRNWCPSGLRRQLEDNLSDMGIESAFPKTFLLARRRQGTDWRLLQNL